MPGGVQSFVTDKCLSLQRSAFLNDLIVNQEELPNGLGAGWVPAEILITPRVLRLPGALLLTEDVGPGVNRERGRHPRHNPLALRVVLCASAPCFMYDDNENEVPKLRYCVNIVTLLGGCDVLQVRTTPRERQPTN